MDELLPLAKKVGEKLKARKETVGISESSAGGLISAVLLAIPGASAYFMGGAVVYTRPAGEAFLGATPSRRSGIRSSSEPWAQLAAELVRDRLKTNWVVRVIRVNQRKIIRRNGCLVFRFQRTDGIHFLGAKGNQSLELPY